MLPADRRLTDSPSFGHAVRRGRCAGSRTMVVHVAVREGSMGGTAGDAASWTRLGLVVSRAVGNAVARNRVKRRLRHLMASRWEALPTGVDVVVRALPPSAAAESTDLGRDLDHCLERCLRRESAGTAS